MTVEIGKRYYEERQRIVDGINSSRIAAEKDIAVRNRCYLCRSRIASGTEMRIVIVEGSGRNKGYRFLHEGCYQSVLSR